jgi:hypothetical protein
MPLCGWDLVRAVGGASHPIAACLKGRMGTRALTDLPSLILELSVSSSFALWVFLCLCVWWRVEGIQWSVL